jgi:hypothetical protein
VLIARGSKNKSPILNLGVVLQQSLGPPDQIAEIVVPTSLKLGFVTTENLCEVGQQVAFCGPRRLVQRFVTYEIVLEEPNRICDLAHKAALVSGMAKCARQRSLPKHVPDEHPLLKPGQQAVGPRNLALNGIPTEQVVAERVKRRYREGLDRASGLELYPMAKLRGRLLGKGENEDSLGISPGCNQLKKLGD